MHNMNYRLNFLVLYGGLVMNLWLLSIDNLLLMDDRLLLDYSSRRNLRMMEHAFVDNRLLNNLLLNHMSWLCDICWLSNIGWLSNNLLLNHMSWLSNIGCLCNIGWLSNIG